MKSLLKYLFIALIAITLIPVSSCKKGPNDPFISLRSRAARLAGTWKLTNAAYTITQVDGNKNTTIEYTYDVAVGKMSYTKTEKIGNAQPTVSKDSYTYTETWTIDKANTYTRNSVEDAFPVTETGSWAFLNKDKDAELKNKEAVVLLPNKIVSAFGTDLNGKTDAAEVVVLDELSNKKIVITINESSDTSKPGDPKTKTRIGTYTYEQ